MKSAGLNEHHLRRLTTAMALIDAAAARILDALNINPDPSPINVREGSISPEENKGVTALIRRLRPLAWEFSAKYGLQPKRRDVRRFVVAEISHMWTILENLHANKLRGLGPISEAAALQLNADVDRMLKIVEELRRALFPG